MLISINIANGRPWNQGYASQCTVGCITYINTKICPLGIISDSEFCSDFEAKMKAVCAFLVASLLIAAVFAEEEKKEEKPVEKVVWPGVYSPWAWPHAAYYKAPVQLVHPWPYQPAVHQWW